MSELNAQQSNSTDITFFPMEYPFVLAPAVSALASFIVMIVCLCNDPFKTPLGKMLFHINLADFFFCFPKSLTAFILPSSDIFCKLIQLVTQFGLISSAVWGALFGHTLMIFSQRLGTEKLSNCMKYYYIFALILPAILSFLGLVTKYVNYSETEEACIHRVYHSRPDYHYIFFIDIPLLSACFFSVLWYLLAAKQLKKMLSKQETKFLFTLIVYPAILLVCWVPILTTNALIMYGLNVKKGLYVAFQALDHMQGLLDAVVYGGGMLKICGRGRENTRSSYSNLAISLQEEGYETSVLASTNLRTSQKTVDLAFSQDNSRSNSSITLKTSSSGSFRFSVRDKP